MVTSAVHVHPCACLKSTVDGLESHDTVDDMKTGFPSISSNIDIMLLHTNLEPSIVHDGSDICSTRPLMLFLSAKDAESRTDEANNVIVVDFIAIV